MPLSDAYARIRPSLAAIIADLNGPRDPVLQMPEIIGSGFVVHPDGLVATAGHVVDALEKIRGANPGVVPGVALFFDVDDPERGIVGGFVVTKPIIRFTSFRHDPGQPPAASAISLKSPDLGLVQIPLTGLPSVVLDNNPRLVEGHSVGVAGFPLGNDLLSRVGAVGHLGPTLRTGAISARLMSPEGVIDAGFLYEVLNQGGSSGSPVFDEGGRVVGIHVEWQRDTQRLINDVITRTVDHHHTGLSVAVSARVLVGKIEWIRGRTELLDDGQPVIMEPGADWQSWGKIVAFGRTKTGEVEAPGTISVLSSAEVPM
jgi:S1-C subfamily serine protease